MIDCRESARFNCGEEVRWMNISIGLLHVCEKVCYCMVFYYYLEKRLNNILFVTIVAWFLFIKSPFLLKFNV